MLDQIQEFGGQPAAEFMQNWKDKTLYYVKSDGRFVIVEPAGKDDAAKIVTVIDAVSKQPLGQMSESASNKLNQTVVCGQRLPVHWHLFSWPVITLRFAVRDWRP